MSATASPDSIRTFLGKPNNRRLVLTVLLVCIGLHLLGGIGAAIWVVARYFDRPEVDHQFPPAAHAGHSTIN